jgi:hypothetical protein
MAMQFDAELRSPIDDVKIEELSIRVLFNNNQNEHLYTTVKMSIITIKYAYKRIAIL